MHMPPHGHVPHPPLDGIDPVSANVFAAFRRATHVNRQLMGRLMADKGAHPGAAAVLRVLADRDGISQRDLAELLHLSRPTVTAMLQRMEQAGLVERWDDEADQRLTRIRLTPKGREHGENLRSSFVEYVEGTLGTLSEADRLELARLLDLLADNTEATLKRLGTDARSDKND